MKYSKEELNKIYHNHIVPKQGITHQISHYYQPKGYWKYRIDRIISIIKPQKADNILDLGCGVGTFAFHAGKNSYSVGLDYSWESVHMAKNITKNYYGLNWIDYICADATNLPFKEDSFDKVVSVDFIEHLTLSQKKAALDEIAIILKKGCMFLIGTPNSQKQYINSARRMIKDFFSYNKDRVLYEENITHIGEVSIPLLRKLLKHSGFTRTKLIVTEDLEIEIRNNFSHFISIKRSISNILKQIPFVKNFIINYILMIAIK